MRARYIVVTKEMYWNMFKANFLISAFTVGGGYVLIPLMKAKIVDEYKWLTEEESLNMVAMAQTAPGAVAINCAIAMGYKIGGIPMALVGVLATMLPPLIMLSLISVAYDCFATNMYVKYALKGMQCGATAIIINVVGDLLDKQIRKKLYLPMLIIIGTFAARFMLGISLMYLLLIDGIVGLIFMQDKKYN